MFKSHTENNTNLSHVRLKATIPRRAGNKMSYFQARCLDLALYDTPLGRDDGKWLSEAPLRASSSHVHTCMDSLLLKGKPRPLHWA